MREVLRKHPRASVAVALGLAAAVVVVVATTFLGRGPAGVEPSVSPGATSVASARPSPQIADSCRLELGPSQGPDESLRRPFVAIVLVDDLRVRSEAGLSGTEVALLHSGQVVWINEGPAPADGSDWYQVQIDAERGGWVSAGPVDGPYLDLRTQLPVNVPASILGLSAGPDGFLAWGVAAHRSDESPQPVVVTSEDGICWHGGGVPTEMVGPMVSAGWGPAGWIAVTSDEFRTEAGAFWRSDDGMSWTRLPAFDAPVIVPQALVGSTAGYALTVVDNRTGTSRPNLYFSPDGLAWNEVGSEPELGSAGVIAIEPGFLRWRTGDSGTLIRLSADGQTWQDAGGALPGPYNKDPLFASAGGWLVAVTTEYSRTAESGTTVQSIWRAVLGGPELVWERQTDAEALVADNSIDSLISGGSTILAVGYEPANAALRMWSTMDGSSWTEVPADGVFGGVVSRLVAGTDAGFAAVGGTFTAAGTNPIFWHATNFQSWESEAQQVMGSVESPVAGACPGLPTTMVDWLVIPGSLGAACFGDSPITFRGWLTVGGGCGGFTPGTWEPAWLASPFATFHIILTPFEAVRGGCGSAARHPELTELPEPQQWVTITGHYNDPAAETCSWTPDPLYKFAVVREGLELACRQRFVASEVMPASP